MAVQASLGSALLTAALAVGASKPIPASTGCRVIDNALEGGFGYGEITSMAGAAQTGKTLIAMHAAAGHLLTNQSSDVAVIDTTGSFSPVRLRDVLIERLENTTSSINDLGDGKGCCKGTAQRATNKALIDKAVELLDRVRVMRVFDIPGLLEAVEELQDSPQRGELSGVERSLFVESLANKEDIGGSQEDGSIATGRGIGMIVLDNVANIIRAEMTKNQIRGQSFLVSFLRSISDITIQRSVCTILIHAAVGLGSGVPPGEQNQLHQSSSVFAESSGRPGLGKTFAHLLDLSILLSNVRKRSAGFKAASDEGGDATDASETIGVFEIIEDRNGCRSGNWAPFETRNGTRLESG